MLDFFFFLWGRHDPVSDLGFTGISQRDYTQHYQHISKQEASISSSIQQFFREHVQHQFPNDDCESPLIDCTQNSTTKWTFCQSYDIFLSPPLPPLPSLPSSPPVVLDVYRDSTVRAEIILLLYYKRYLLCYVFKESVHIVCVTGSRVADRL